MTEAVKKGSRIESTLGALVSHPTRVKSYVILAERVASPNEIALEIGLDVGHVSYHVKKLAELDMVELIDVRPVRGANEHFYKATKRPIVSDADFEGMNPEERDALTRYTLQLHLTDAARALEAGTFDARTNRWLVRMQLQVDEEGFAELGELHEEMYERKLEIEARSAERMAAGESTSIPTVDTAMFFELPTKRRR
jgi:DNA-binding transcriptional ArsR family regulator